MSFQERYVNDDIAQIIYEELMQYEKGELPKLLIECQIYLTTNDIYFKKLKKHGLFINLVTGIERKCNRRILNNFQSLHVVTLKIIEIILSRFENLEDLVMLVRREHDDDMIFVEYCIGFLQQKIYDHKKLLQGLNMDVRLLKWQLNTIEEYSGYSDTKKILHIVSDLYDITKGHCGYGEIDFQILKKVMKDLELSNDNVRISPIDFAGEILQDSGCLHLYIKYELDYKNAALSDYGAIVRQINELAIDQNVQKLSVARGDGLKKLCMPLIEESNRYIEAMPAGEICRQLLDDLAMLYSEYEEEYFREQALVRKSINDEKKRQEKILLKQQEEQRYQKRYTLTILSPAKIKEYSLSNYTGRSFYLQPTKDNGLDEKNKKYAGGLISDFSPSVIIKPDGIPGGELAGTGYGNGRLLIRSLADFHFCLWYNKHRKHSGNGGHIALIDYYDDKYYISCYSYNNEGEVIKKAIHKIRSSRVPGNVKRDISSKFFPGVPSDDIILSRVFGVEEYYDKKRDKDINKRDKDINKKDKRFDRKEIPIIDSGFDDSFDSVEEFTSAMDLLYDLQIRQETMDETEF